MRRSSKSSVGLGVMKAMRKAKASEDRGVPLLGDGTPYRVGMLVRLPEDTLRTPPVSIEWVNRPLAPGEPWRAVTRGRGTWPLADLVAAKEQK